jgi:hypothetical protein
MNRLMQLSLLLELSILSTNVIAGESSRPSRVEGKLVAQLETVEESEPGEATDSTEGSAAIEEPAPDSAPGVDPDTMETSDISGSDSSAEVAADASSDSAEEAEPEEEWDILAPWEMDFHGYFRGPFRLSFSKRRDPQLPDSSEELQVKYESNGLVDTNGSTFGYTRLNESEWGELFVTAKKKHVAATIAFMGSWYQFVAGHKDDSIVAPGLGWITLDTDFNLGSLRPHIALKMGAFLQVYGAFGKYDTYLFGRHHNSGETLELTIPVSDNLSFRLNDGIGYYRSGTKDTGFGAVMVHHLHAGANIKKVLNIGFYFNHNWTKDPTLFQNSDPTKILGPYSEARKAKMMVVGLDAHINASRFGHLWLAYSHITLENGWAITGAGTEIMHSGNGGQGIIDAYMPNGNGDGSQHNVAWLYENTLSNLRGLDSPSFPEVTLNLFGMLAAAKFDLDQNVPEGAPDSTTQIKGGADLTLHPLSWLGFMVRYDGVDAEILDPENNNNDLTNFKYHILTPRIIFSSHILSSESLWIQFSHYWYGNDVFVTDSTGAHTRPDANVLKMQCNIGW